VLRVLKMLRMSPSLAVDEVLDEQLHLGAHRGDHRRREQRVADRIAVDAVEAAEVEELGEELLDAPCARAGRRAGARPRRAGRRRSAGRRGRRRRAAASSGPVFHIRNDSRLAISWPV
jgi:hypothetical protein